MEEKLFAGNPNPKETIVTPRGYLEVCKDLLFSPDELPSGASLLSFGEGLSNFARTIQKQRPDLRVVASDPIYSVIDPTDTMDMAQKKLREAGAGWINEHISKEPAPPASSRGPHEISTASIYKLPFPDASFNRVTSNRTLEHINIGAAIPELVRILKAHGEIRLGSPLLIFEREDKHELFIGMPNRTADGGKYFQEYGGIPKLFSFLKDKPELHVYAISYGMAKRGKAIVIRNDDQLPIIGLPKEATEPEPGSALLYRVLPESYTFENRMVEIVDA